MSHGRVPSSRRGHHTVSSLLTHTPSRPLREQRFRSLQRILHHLLAHVQPYTQGEIQSVLHRPNNAFLPDTGGKYVGMHVRKTEPRVYGNYRATEIVVWCAVWFAMCAHQPSARLLVFFQGKSRRLFDMVQRTRKRQDNQCHNAPFPS